MPFRFRRPFKRAGGDEFTPASKETMDQLSLVLLKIVGESVNGKLLRAILVGGISAATFYAQDPGQPPAVNPAPEVTSSAPQAASYQ